MSEWETIFLGDHCRISTGKKDVNEGSPFGQYPFFTCSRNISWSEFYSFDCEAILIAGNGDVGNLHYYKGKFEAYQRTYVLNSFEIDVHYVIQYLQENLLSRLKRDKIGTSIPYIKLEHLRDLPITLPKSIFTQQKIARILQTVDRAMEKTEALIEKYQQIKAGLMHDLFTRGLWTQEEIDRGDHHGTPAAAKPGQLRPTRQDAPHLYQQTPIGWIPKAWEAVPIKKLYKNPIRDFGSFSSTNLITFLQEGVPFIKSEMIKEEEVDWSNVSFVSKAVHRLLSKSHVNAGQILFSKIGSALGKAVLYCGERGECNSNAAVAKIELNENLVRPQLVEVFLNSKFARKQFELMIISLLPRINLGDIDKLIVPLPQVHEQDIICERYLSLKLRLRGEIAFLAKLQKQKSGLMHDLLTGKVPVTPDPEEADGA